MLPTPTQLRRGFTLIEILIVISIIVILAALTVPVFNVLTGSRSIDGATNTMSAMLSRARAEAISRKQTIGLAIFADATRDRVALALVSQPLPWTPGTSYQRGDVVSVVTSLRSSARPAVTTTYYFICHTLHISDASDATLRAPDNGPVDGQWTLIPAGSPYAPELPNPGASPPRRYAISTYVTLIPETELLYLPPGVGAQVLNSARSTGTGAAAQLDRYMHAGVVFFDADGKLAVGKDWGVLYNDADLRAAGTARHNDIVSSRLGLLVQFDADPNSSTDSNNLDPIREPNADRLSSGLGVTLFDRQAYLTRGFPKWDAQVDLSRGYTIGGTLSEQAKEAWLDENGTLLLLNRFNGTLLRTE